MPKFNKTFFNSLAPKKHPYLIYEGGGTSGFAIQVLPSGNYSYVSVFYFNGKKVPFTLGKGQYMTEEEAREFHIEVRKLVAKGIDPRQYYDEQKKAAKLKWQQEEEKKKLGTLDDLISYYCDWLDQEEKSSAKEVRRSLTVNTPDRVARKIATAVTTEDIRLIVKAVYDRGAKTAANRLRTQLYSAFEYGYHFDNSVDRNFHDKVFKIEKNPVTRFKKPSKENKSDRWLDRDELLAFWNSLPNSGISKQMEYILKLLILTSGQRVKEVVEARWVEMKFYRKLWILPKERSKTGNLHYIILNKHAIKLINKLKTKNSKYLFPSPRHKKLGDVPIRFGSVSKAVQRICEQNDFIHFSPRDLRRTAKTLMGEAGISAEIRSRVQNHAIPGMGKRYDFHSYEKQFREASDVWVEFLENEVGIDI